MRSFAVGSNHEPTELCRGLIAAASRALLRFNGFARLFLRFAGLRCGYRKSSYRSSVVAWPYMEGSSIGPEADQTARNGIGLCREIERGSEPNW
jgi:hypothetical protein